MVVPCILRPSVKKIVHSLQHLSTTDEMMLPREYADQNTQHAWEIVSILNTKSCED